MSSLFFGSNISSFYRAARPRYPASVINSIVSSWKQLMSHNKKDSDDLLNCGELQKSGIALDVGCGSGQLTELLSFHFSRVIASDISATQIAAAKEEFFKLPNIEFHVGDCYSLPCQDHSADLVAVAQAAHWFDLPKFYTEVSRCLKPTGALALLSYSFCSIRLQGEQNQEREARVNKLLHEFFQGEKYLGPYWDSRRQLVDSKYETLPMYNANKCIRVTEDMPLNLTMSQFVTYMKSFSAYHTYLEQVKPDPESDILNNFVSQLSSVLKTPESETVNPADKGGSSNPEPTLLVVFPLTVIVSMA